MTRLISKMDALAAPEAYPSLYLEGRIAYRKAWASKQPKIARQFREKDRKWELEYDDENNFAHMGARFVDEDWGKPKTAPKKKTKPKSLSPEVLHLLKIVRETAR